MKYSWLILLSFSFSLAQWPQTEFGICAHGDPELSGTTAADIQAYQKMRDANFNCTKGLWSRGPGTIDGGSASNSWGTYNDPGINNVYRLGVIAQVPGLRSFVDEWRISPVNSQPKLADALTLYRDDLPITSSAARSVLLGYHIGDEPRLDTLSTIILPTINSLAIGDLTRISIATLGHFFRTGFVWADYKAYVETYFNAVGTRIVTFDYYPFNSLSPNGFTRFDWWVNDSIGNPDHHGSTYFRHLGLFAKLVRTRNLSGSPIHFWGHGNVTKHQNGLSMLFPTPTREQLRYEASANIIYGAKGIFWFGYELQQIPGYLDAPTRNSILYNDLKVVNQEIANMGPVLMELSLSATIHGHPTDPASGEDSLPTIGFSSPARVVLKDQPLNGKCAIGIHRHRKSRDHYLTVMNKSISPGEALSQTISVKGRVTPRLFKKTNKSWQVISSVYDGSTSSTFTLSGIQPGGVEIVWLDRLGWMTPALSPLR